jgi:hypothetical protein
VLALLAVDAASALAVDEAPAAVEVAVLVVVEPSVLVVDAALRSLTSCWTSALISDMSELKVDESVLELEEEALAVELVVLEEDNESR